MSIFITPRTEPSTRVDAALIRAREALTASYRAPAPHGHGSALSALAALRNVEADIYTIADERITLREDAIPLDAEITELFGVALAETSHLGRRRAALDALITDVEALLYAEPATLAA